MDGPFILLLGKDGRLGWELRRTLSPLGNVVAVGREADVRRSGGLNDIIGTRAVALIVNAMAYTHVDGAERDPETAFEVNQNLPGVIAREAARTGTLLVHFSTDYVFDGRASQPYTEHDEPAPINVYGESKLAGEHAVAAADGPHLILRTSWLYSMRRPGFVPTVLRHLRAREPLDVVMDHTGNPTWARVLAEATAQALARLATGSAFQLEPEHCGVYHVSASGHVSRYQLARSIAELDPLAPPGATELLRPVPSREFAQFAARPAFSALDCSRFAETFRLRLPHWEDQLDWALAPEATTARNASGTSPEAPIARPR